MQAMIARHDFESCYGEEAYLREVAYYGTTEADRETWMQNSPTQRATVLTHPPTGTRATPGSHLCSTGLQAAERVTESHILFLMPVTSNRAQSGLVTLVTSPSKFTKITVTTPIHFYAFDKKKKIMGKTLVVVNLV
jgi:hypothetical protein